MLTLTLTEWASQVAQWQRICLPSQRCELDPSSGRPPGEGNGSPLQFSRLGNPMDRGAWRAPQSTGSQRVGRGLVTNNNAATDPMVPAVSFIKTAPRSGSGDMWHIASRQKQAIKHILWDSRFLS